MLEDFLQESAERLIGVLKEGYKGPGEVELNIQKSEEIINIRAAKNSILIAVFKYAAKISDHLSWSESHGDAILKIQITNSEQLAQVFDSFTEALRDVDVTSAMAVREAIEATSVSQLYHKQKAEEAMRTI